MKLRECNKELHALAEIADWYGVDHEDEPGIGDYVMYCVYRMMQDPTNPNDGDVAAFRSLIDVHHDKPKVKALVGYLLEEPQEWFAPAPPFFDAIIAFAIVNGSELFDRAIATLLEIFYTLDRIDMHRHTGQEQVVLEILSPIIARASAAGVTTNIDVTESWRNRCLTVLTAQRAVPIAERAPKNRGWLYVLTNSHMPGLVKIGRTDRDPKTRVDELSSATGIPTPFVLVWDEEVSDSAAAESEVHAYLKECRVSLGREFFRIDVKAAIQAVTAVSARYASNESDASPHRASSAEWECDDELLIASLRIAQDTGSIDPRVIRMRLGVDFVKSRELFDKLKSLNAVRDDGTVVRSNF